MLLVLFDSVIHLVFIHYYLLVPGQLPLKKLAPRLGLEFGLVLGLGDNFPRGQLS